ALEVHLHLARREPEDPVELVGPRHAVGGHVPAPGADVGEPLGLAELPLARAERRLGGLRLGDVAEEPDDAVVELRDGEAVPPAGPRRHLDLRAERRARLYDAG